MPCECDRVPFEFARALRRVIDGFNGQQGAMAILRNGGAELTLKSLSLRCFEDILNCHAFTERNRVDLLLVCRNCELGWAHVEFKHNFASQLREVISRAENAMRQLQSAKGPLATRQFYVQLIVSLDAPKDSRLRAVHDEYATAYKRFANNNAALLSGDGVSEVPWIHLEHKIASTRDIPDEKDDSATARLHAWAWLRNGSAWQSLG